MISYTNEIMQVKLMSDIGIVILNYNTYDLTCNLVNQAIEMDIFKAIVLVDNHSKDDFEDFCKDKKENVIYVKAKENGGYAKGNNIGLRLLAEKGCRIAFIANPDVVFEKACIINISNFLKENKDYVIASCSRTKENGELTGQYWWIPDFKYTLLEALVFGHRYLDKKCIIKTNRDKTFDGGYYKTVEVVGGAFFGCELSKMETLGYLDENTFLWYEENIISYKIREAGLKVGFLNNCKYIHNHKKIGRGNKNMKILLASKRYYCYEYLKINPLQKAILACFDFVGMMEQKVICKFFNR